MAFMGEDFDTVLALSQQGCLLLTGEKMASNGSVGYFCFMIWLVDSRNAMINVFLFQVPVNRGKVQ